MGAISSTSVEAQISVTEGVTRGYEISDTHSWSLSVTESISGGFGANGASGTIGISGTEAVTISHTYSSTFAQSKSTTETMGPFQPGTIWQCSGLWAMSVEHRSFRVMTLSAPRAVMNHLVVCLVTSKILPIPEVSALRAKTAKFSTSVLRRWLFEEEISEFLILLLMCFRGHCLKFHPFCCDCRGIFLERIP